MNLSKSILDIYSLKVLRAVDEAGEDGWANANEVADLMLREAESGVSPWGLVRAASRGKVYGDLRASYNSGFLEMSRRHVRGKEVKFYRLTPGTRKAVNDAYAILYQQISEARRKSIELSAVPSSMTKLVRVL